MTNENEPCNEESGFAQTNNLGAPTKNRIGGSGSGLAGLTRIFSKMFSGC